MVQPAMPRPWHQFYYLDEL